MKAGQEKGKENNQQSLVEKSGEKYISIKRIIYLSLMTASCIGTVFVLSFIKGMLPDTAILTSILTVLFLLVFILELRSSRLAGRFSYDDTSYKNLFISFAASCLCMVVSGFIPDYFFLAACIGILLTAVMDAGLSFSTGIFFIVLFSVISGSGIYAAACSLMLFTISALLCDVRKENGFSYYLLMILLFVQFIMPQIFYYFSHASYEKKYFLVGACEAPLDGLAFYFIFPFFEKKSEAEEQKTFDDILDDDYSLVQDMKHYSMAEYLHARRVQKAAEGCAGIIHRDEYTLAAAGFYYRLGKIYGEPESENAVKAAVNHCFPERVIDIISKYGTADYFPKTKEEAVVHISNEVITRLELLDSEKKDTFSSGWNQSMVVIQFLNELSSKGYYDESTISINEFLRIRDFLAETELLKID